MSDYSFIFKHMLLKITNEVLFMSTDITEANIPEHVRCSTKI